MRELILDSLLANRDALGSGGRPAPRRWWELFGYDFLIDEDLRIYLVEVNTNPFLGFQVRSWAFWDVCCVCCGVPPRCVPARTAEPLAHAPRDAACGGHACAGCGPPLPASG